MFQRNFFLSRLISLPHTHTQTLMQINVLNDCVVVSFHLVLNIVINLWYRCSNMKWNYNIWHWSRIQIRQQTWSSDSEHYKYYDWRIFFSIFEFLFTKICAFIIFYFSYLFTKYSRFSSNEPDPSKVFSYTKKIGKKPKPKKINVNVLANLILLWKSINSKTRKFFFHMWLFLSFFFCFQDKLALIN